jgi:hypothetical protein
MAGNGAAVAETTDAEIQKLLDDWRAKLIEQTEAYVEAMTELKKGGAGIAAPVTGGYPWWNLVVAGPYQALGGPYLPNKIVKGGAPLVFLGALWRKPMDFLPGASAAMVMNHWDFNVTFQSVDVSTVTKGPEGGPISMNLSHYPGSYSDLFAAVMTFPAAGAGDPHLYEVNAVADLTGPDGTNPYAGYSTWILNPDYEPPFLGLPPVGPHFTYDQPARILVYA